MKIVHFIPSLDTGGAEKLVTDLMLNFNRAVNDICLVVFYKEKNTYFEKKLKEKNINIYFLNKKKGFDFFLLIRLIKFLKKLQPDIVNSHLNTFPYVVFATKYLKKKPKVFHTFHTIANKEVSGILFKIYKFIFSKFDVNVIGISKQVTESIKEIYKVEKVLTIYNGIDYDNFYCNKNIEERKIDFIAVGSLIYVKRHELLIKAMKKVITVFPNSKLIILGKGELYDDLNNKIKTLGLQNNIELMGVVSNVRDYLFDSKIFLMSSYWEGNPLSLLEASAAGCVILSTNVGGISDIIKDNINGFFSDGDEENFANKMIYILENQDRMKKIITLSQINTQEYDIKRVCENYLEAYK